MKRYVTALFAVALMVLLSATGAQCADLFNVEGSGGQNVRITSTGAILGDLESAELATTSDTVTAAESGRVFIVNSTGSNEATFTLPDASAGLHYTFIAGDNDTFHVDTQDSDTIKYGSIVMAAGDKLSSPSSQATGDTVTFFATGSSTWYTTSNKTFIDGN